MSYRTKLQMGLAGGSAAFDTDDRDEAARFLAKKARRLIKPLVNPYWPIENYLTLLAGRVIDFNHYQTTVEPILVFLSVELKDLSFYLRGWGEDFEDVWVRKYIRGEVFAKEVGKRWRKVRTNGST